MKDIKEGWIFVIAIGALAVGFVLGIGATLDMLSDHCDNLHAFDHRGTVYECRAIKSQGTP